MPSSIDKTIPIANTPLSAAELRDNFVAAADDIEALQADIAATASDWGDIGGTLSAQTDLQTALDDAGTTATWGDITGTLADQTDLQTAIDDIDTAINDAGETAIWGDITGTLSDQTDLDTAFTNIADRLDSIENLGHYVGAFATFAAVPTNVSGFAPLPVTVNDFITVRADETQSGATTRYIVDAIAADGTITWAYDITYSTDITGKMDLAAAATDGNLAEFDSAGQVVDAGKKLNDLMEVVASATSGNLAAFGAGGQVTDAGVTAASKMNVVTGATTGNLAAFDAAGQITDVGKALADLMDLVSDQTVTGVKNFNPPTITDCDQPFVSFGIRILRTTLATANKPALETGNQGFIIQHDISATYRIQLAMFDGSQSRMWTRLCIASVWQPWREVLDSAFLSARTISNVDLADLQTTINGLPKYLNRDITINVNAGDITTDIVVERFCGPGTLSINGGAAAVANRTHMVNRVNISYCTVTRMALRGFTTTATTGTAWYIGNCSFQYLYLYYCNAVGGDPTVTTNLGFYANESSHIYCSECLCEDKFKAWWGRSGRLRVGGPRGTNNTWGFDGEYAGIVQIHGTVPATLVNGPNNLYRQSGYGGIVIGPDGNEQSTVPGRRTTDFYLTLTTDDLAAHSSQTLAAYIKQAVQDTLFTTTTSTYTLRVFIRAGVSTSAALRCIGLDMRYAYVLFYVDPGVTLHSITMWGNKAASLAIVNCGNVTNSVDISYNLVTIGDVYYNGNWASTTLPTHPTGHPLAGQPVLVERCRINGGIMMQRNKAHTIYCALGQFCEVGVPDANDTIPDPAVGTNANGGIQLIFNKCTNDCYVYLYAPYMENLSPPMPGPKVAGRIYVQQNECGGGAFINNMSSWTEEGRCESENCYVYYNKCSSAYVAMGSSSPATSFTGYFTAVAAADNSTTSRNTVTFNAPLNAAWAAAVVGMGFTFINEGTTSLAGNYTGTFKTVTAYDPGTNTITLSANFTNPRGVANAVGYFFSGAGQTRFYYGTNAKIEYMAQQALADSRPVGFKQLDNNNLATAFRITAVDTATKVLTITPGLPSYGLYSSANYICGLFGPNTVGNHSMTFHKIAANQFRSIGDQRIYSHAAEAIVGCKVTGGGIPAGQHRTVATADWGGAGFESRLIMTFDTDDDSPVSATTTLSFIVRRVPYNAHHAVVYNTVQGAAYIVVGHWAAGSNGGVKCRSTNLCYNVCGTSAYTEIRDHTGNAVNPDGSARVSYVDVIYNYAGASAYIQARSNNLPGGGGGFDRLRLYRNTCGDEGYITIGTNTTATRPVELYYNKCGYRCYLDCILPPGMTISAANAPQLLSNVTMYRNVAPQIWINRMNIKPALIGETGRAPDLQCWNCDGNLGRTYVGSASLWLDVSNNAAANASCIYALNNSYFEYGFAVPSTYGGTQCYALRLNEAQRVKISARPATMPKIKVEGYSLVHFGSTLMLDNIYKDDHLEGRGANVVLLQRGETIDDPREALVSFTTPGTYTYTVPITSPDWIIAVGAAGGGGAVSTGGTARMAGGGSGAIASGLATLTAGTLLTVIVGARGNAFIGDNVNGAGTAGGLSSVTGGGVTVSATGGGGGSVTTTTATGGVAGTFTVTGSVLDSGSNGGAVGTNTGSGGRSIWGDTGTGHGHIINASGRGGYATATTATAGFDGMVRIFLAE